MKKIFILTGVIVLIMTILLVSDFMNLGENIGSYVRTGNEYYENLGDNEKAKESYMEGLEIKAEDLVLNYNLGLVEYVSGNYSQSVNSYSLSDNAYMELGNAHYRLASGLEDQEEIKNEYEIAMEQYLLGMEVEPDNVELKYNYEFVKKLMEDQESQDQEENQDQQDQEQGDEDQEESQEEQDGQDQQDGQEQENEGQEDKEESQEQENQEESQEQEDREESQEQEDQGEGQEQEESEGQVSETMSLTEEEIDQILKMLEQQEEESLKNNQFNVNQGQGEEYDW